MQNLLWRGPDVFACAITYETADGNFAVLRLEWNGSEAHEEVREKLIEARNAEPQVVKPAWRAKVLVEEDGTGTGDARVRVWPELLPATMKGIEVQRQPGSGSPGNTGRVQGLLANLGDLGSVERLKLGEGLSGVVQQGVEKWRSLRSLDLSLAGLVQLPEALGHLDRIERLHIDKNKLTSLPKSLGSLSRLQVFTADSNSLGQPCPELSQCSRLRKLSVEFNRLASPLADVSSFPSLEELLLAGNPLESVPDLSQCPKLRRLTLLNINIESSSRILRGVKVTTGEGAATSFLQGFRSQYSNAWVQFCTLVFKHTSCQHPLVSSAIASLCESKPGCDAVMKVDGAPRNIVSMVNDDNTSHVVSEAANALIGLAQHTKHIEKIAEVDGWHEAVIKLLRQRLEARIEQGLQFVATAAYSSQRVSRELLSSSLLELIEGLAKGHSSLAGEALRALGNLCFEETNRKRVAERGGLRTALERIGEKEPGRVRRREALRVIAILGQNRVVERAMKRGLVSKRGVRVLAMDGGGMRGLATIRMLERLEAGTGKRVHELFDLIGGTSTGGILAVALGVKKLSLTECRRIYTELSKYVFQRHVSSQKEEVTWRDYVSQWYENQSQKFRVAVSGCKHDAASFEHLLRERCEIDSREVPLVDAAIRCGGPKVFCTATRVSAYPAEPFVFRTYNFPPGTGSDVLNGSCHHLLWHGVRASSAAPYYLADFALGGERWQDGAVSCNNPAVVAVQEARAVWPEFPLECVVSLGSGAVPSRDRDPSTISKYIDAGAALVESACSVERADESLRCLLPLLPGCSYYRFQPVHDACGIDLDDNDDAALRALESATNSYMANVAKCFDEVCSLLAEPFPRYSMPDREPAKAIAVFVSPPYESMRHASPERLGGIFEDGDDGNHDGEPSILARADVSEKELEACLTSKKPRFLILALRGFPGRCGLVLSWRSRYSAFAHGSQGAESLLAGANCESLASLPAEFVSADGVAHKRISAGWQRTSDGRSIASAVVEAFEPDILLTPARIRSRPEPWRGVVAACGSDPGEEMVHAFLDAGCSAVVVPREGGCDEEGLKRMVLKAGAREGHLLEALGEAARGTGWKTLIRRAGDLLDLSAGKGQAG